MIDRKICSWCCKETKNNSSLDRKCLVSRYGNSVEKTLTFCDEECYKLAEFYDFNILKTDIINSTPPQPNSLRDGIQRIMQNNCPIILMFMDCKKYKMQGNCDKCEIVNKTTSEIIKVFIDMLPKNPYPKDIWIPMTKEQLAEVHKLLQEKMGIPLDRLTGEIGRRTWNSLIEEIEQKLEGGK